MNRNTPNDAAQLEAIGKRLTQARIRMEWTQAELAKEAGIGKRTLERLEAGQSVQMTSFIRVLRVLGLLDVLVQLLPEPAPSPMQLLKHAVEEPQRVYKARKKKDNSTADESTPKPWVWGEDR